MRLGHAAILIDMPSGPAYAYEIACGQKCPYGIGYRAEQVLNWRSTVVSGKTVLDQVTLRECGYEADGMFGEKELIRYRVLHRANDPATDQPVIAWTI